MKRHPSRARWAHGRFIILALLSVLLGSAQAQNVCIKEPSAAPPVDGVVAPGLASGGCAVDAVWGGVSPGAFQPDDSLPAASLYLAYRASSLYVGLAVQGDEDLSDQDYILLYFDADNSNAFDSGDFVLRIEVSASSISSGKQCNVNTGMIELYVHDGTSWVLDNAGGGQVTARIAYDYQTSDDPEDQVWNLELQMPVTGSFDLDIVADPASASFGVGAFLFADDGNQQAPQVGTVLRWPDAVTTTPSIGATNPNFITLDAGELANASITDVCFDVNFSAPNAWRINGQPAASGDHRINEGVSNDFMVTFQYEGPAGAAGEQPNEGTVRLALKPYGNITTGSEYEWIKELPVAATTINAAEDVTFTYNFGSPPANWGDFAEINFVCATMTLEEFQRDDDETNNSLNVNYNYFQTSEYGQMAYLMADRIPGLRDGEQTEILLQAHTSNERSLLDRSGRGSAGPVFRWPGSGGGWVALLLSVLAALTAAWALQAGRLRRGLAWSLIGLAFGAGLTACRTLPDIPGIPGLTQRWEFANARELGIRPIQGEPGWYTMPITVGEPVPLELNFEGMALPYEPRQMQLNPQSGDNQPGRIDLPVESGRVLAVVATGQVDLDGPNGSLPPASAAGIADEQADGRYLLTDGYYTPEMYAGALIGSFDGFETSFVVGRETALLVPSNASTLSLAVNATPQQFGQITGALDLYLVDRPPPLVPTATRLRGDGTFSVPFVLPLWEALTSLNLYTYYVTTETNDRGQVVAETRHPLGFSHYTVYNRHLDSPDGTPQRRR
ncbi:MAG: hypothetical protein HKN04_14265 [Rhodothermaceae bacterium]|nr:hypothetical protein [Rhodothermaceae bacterium]